MEESSLIFQLLRLHNNTLSIVCRRPKDGIGLFFRFIEKILCIVLSLFQDVMSLIFRCMFNLFSRILGQNNRLAQRFLHFVKDRETILEGFNLCFLSMIFMNQVLIITSDDIQKIINFLCVIASKFGAKGLIF